MYSHYVISYSDTEKHVARLSYPYSFGFNFAHFQKTFTIWI